MSDCEDEQVKRTGIVVMYDTKELMNALRTLFAPLIKEVVLETIDEHQRAQEPTTTECAEVTPEKVMELLNISRTTLWRWAREGYLVPVKVGRKTLYRQSDIDTILKGDSGK